MKFSVKIAVRIVLRVLFVFFAMSPSMALAWNTTNIFPLGEGMKWTYTGTWENINGDKKTPISPTSIETKVLRFVNGSGYIGAHMQGHPTDIESLESGEVKLSTYVYYILGTNVYMITNQANMGSAMRGRYDPKPEELFMALPLKPGAFFGKIAGESGWLVETINILVPALRSKMAGYRLILKNENKVRLMTFVPLVGITSYSYVDYNTGDKLHINLSEYKTGN